MMVIEYRSSKGGFKAFGLYDEGKFIIKAGSTISAKSYESMPDNLRKCIFIEDGKYILNINQTFNSASAAAKFVSGNSTNGLRAWKDEKGQPIGLSIKGNSRRPKGDYTYGKYRI